MVVVGGGALAVGAAGPGDQFDGFLVSIDEVQISDGAAGQCAEYVEAVGQKGLFLHVLAALMQIDEGLRQAKHAAVRVMFCHARKITTHLLGW